MFPQALQGLSEQVSSSRSMNLAHPSDLQLPHSSKQLNKATVEQSRSDDDIGDGHTVSLGVDEREDDW